MEKWIDEKVNGKALEHFHKELLTNGTQLHGIEIYEKRNCLVRWAIAPYSCEDKRECYSISKSYTATAFGIAYDKKLLHPDDLLSKYFPKEVRVQTDSRWTRMRLRHLLSMTTGHSSCTMPQMAFASDAMAAFFETPLEYNPGEYFAYNTGSSCVLAEVIHRAAGQEMLDFLTEHLFSPMDIEDVCWSDCVDGHNQGGTGIQLSCDDIAKLGRLYIQMGVWEGQQLISKDWIQMATLKQVETNANGAPDWCAGYGYQFWMNEKEGYRADGAFGQMCIILPKREIVVAIVAESTNMEKEIAVAWQLLECLKGDEGGDGLPHAYEPQGSLSTKVIDSGWLKCNKNKMGFTAMRLKKTQYEAALYLSDGKRTQKIFANAKEWTQNNLLCKELMPLLYRQMPRRNMTKMNFMAAVHNKQDNIIFECRMINSPHSFSIEVYCDEERMDVDIHSPLDVFGQSAYWSASRIKS